MSEKRFKIGDRVKVVSIKGDAPKDTIGLLGTIKEKSDSLCYDWRVFFESMGTWCDDFSDGERSGWKKAIDIWKRKYYALKGQLTRCKKKLETEQTKSAEARELVELLEWAKNTGCISIEIYTDGRVRIYSLGNLIGRNKSLLLALRAAKKTVEGRK